MGLDIYLLQPKKEFQDDEFYLINEHPELAVFEEFITEKENNYFDINKSLSKLNLKEEDLIWRGTEYGKDVIYTFINKTHELFSAFKWINEKWIDCYFDSKKELLESELFKKFKLEFYDLLKKHGWKPSYKFYASGNKETYFNLNSAHKFITK